MSPQERRAYFIYLDLLQLIENVFLDLDFGNNAKWRHPGNAGWPPDSILGGQKRNSGGLGVAEESYGRPFQTYFSDLVEEQKKSGQLNAEHRFSNFKFEI